MDQKKILASLKDTSPLWLKKLPSKNLLDYHRKCHMLYAIHKKKRNKELVNMIVSWHDMIVVEMKNRGYSHNTPLYKL